MLFSRKLFVVLAVILSLVVAMTTTGEVFAQEDSDVMPQFPALSIRAPQVVSPGEIVPIVVTELNSGNPVSGADVWALRWPIVRPLAANAQLAIQPKWQYRFLGTTDADGNVTPPPAFENAGRLLIIATCSGYAPSLHVMVVKPKALAVEVPERVAVDESVTIKVTDRSNGEPVAGAGVYALHQPIRLRILDDYPIQKQRSIDNDPSQIQRALTDKPVLTSTPLPLPEDEIGVSLEDSAVKKGKHLGDTDDNGEITTTFDEPGWYRIVAIKPGYTPGAARMVVYPENELNALTIKCPRSANIDEEVTLTVLERSGGSVVMDADVYALRLPLKLDIINNEKPPMLEPAAEDGARASLKALAAQYGVHIGKTDDNGQITHVFNEQGRHLIIATKDDYIPGITHISIGSLRISPSPIPKAEGKVQIKLYPNPRQLMPSSSQ